jgi:hypothetical protein
LSEQKDDANLRKKSKLLARINTNKRAFEKALQF